ncbi:flagellar biosynthetic protein FliO [Pseudomonas sp. CCI3.2]|uniref:flagellar biosynthetic protein FliO n=1 Tax=unclassified Pseudomonas TaxID=196821 RepID=UPI002AC8A33F|nr:MULTISPECIES: flagellar biosynthetic protein FliO [unclassified Pseudomonas]MEB0078715.1 flagellar biosynthetic protein FliO [Pseudomonas sp. MH10out]MEB0093227.1 flagellar biosynthetic protein FliO [Pseudomonas sp. CCI4.2]MEB0103308.1 flagellar biosynthetic protein FliO [Pseudomonas sp. CCI3.2]MEB0131259.1 flagellar biosynthetic protein FliO [Pseudomonas sp. CCI2.4]MEB0158184.1 flagellar biosynthetic protein FliO [Pseudomonas sp. AH2 (2023)]
MNRLPGVIFALLLSVIAVGAMAAEPVMPAVAAPASTMISGGIGGQLTQLVLGLLLVVGLIFGLAWLLRRVQGANPRNGQLIELLGSRALGPRDRLVLVQVGKEQILLGISPGRITPLHVLKEPVQVPDSENATPEFAQRLMELLGKDHKDKK